MEKQLRTKYMLQVGPSAFDLPRSPASQLNETNKRREAERALHVAESKFIGSLLDYRTDTNQDPGPQEREYAVALEAGRY